MKKTTRLSIVAATSAAMTLSGTAALATVTTTSDAGTFADSILGNASRTGASYVVSSACEEDWSTDDETDFACPTGVATTPFAGFPTAGSTFGVLTSGNAAFADRPNDAPDTSYSYGGEASAIGPDVYDEQTVKIDLGPAGGSCLAFDFRFLSEEFPEYVLEGYNDAFVAQLNTRDVRTEGQQIIAPGNFAAGAGDVVSVDGAGPTAMNEANASGTTYDGATLPLVARTPVAPGSTNSLFLTVFDQGDGVYDSAVLLDNLRYENLPEGQCKSLALDPDEGTTSIVVTAPAAFTPGGVILPLACNLPPGPIQCQTNVSVVATPTAPPSARPPAGERRPAHGRQTLAPVEIASGSFTIPSGTTTTVTVPLTAGAATFEAAARALPGDLRAMAKKKLKKAKALKRKAKKLLKRASTAAPAKAKKLERKARKLRRKAKRLIKSARALRRQATALEALPLGTATITFTNPRNGAVSTASMTIPR